MIQLYHTLHSVYFQRQVTHFVFAMTDAHAAVERARQAGGEITLEPTDVDLGTIKATFAFLRDPVARLSSFFKHISR